ncbi:HlyD family secretion protein [Acidihalobacter ferrooxydans]|uniref:Uncharacterized protein n=1 Tax=Acidihalobacter ferrooxydans TaxID=1765967 RepID=A0A1P8UEH2_9GAMM|nr:HlyD family secretion protein [Acidihalobacter ferrooxydans]APZ42206.1 hypothetical protein BW247_03110 [Acidihalobacter ferrooxydans]
MSIASATRLALTLIVVAIAATLAYLLWQRYMNSPWTRDGRVHVKVLKIAPDVSGRIVAVDVKDDEFVHQGAVLFRIDPARFAIAVQQARANLDAAQAALQAAVANVEQSTAAIAQAQAGYAMRKRDAERLEHSQNAVSRQKLADARYRAQAAHAALRVAQAHQAQAQAAHAQAQAALDRAQAALSLAKLNLRRTTVRAPADGYVTHLRTYAGDYAHAGVVSIALIDSHDFWVTGYFEETKIGHIRIGQRAEIHLLDGTRLQGTVAGIARGIANSGGTTGGDGLANVTPTFTWVRLAQRIPVRIQIDAASLPRNIVLAAGMTATIVIKEHGARRRTHRTSEIAGSTT